jgi:hypothetical protein
MPATVTRPTTIASLLSYAGLFALKAARPAKAEPDPLSQPTKSAAKKFIEVYSF